MAYTARTLITRALFLSGIVARELQSVTAAQISDGLYLLNALLDFKAVQVDLIPYWTYYEFDAVAGQESYFIENLYQIQTVTFNLDTLRYAMDRTGLRKYFGSTRVDDISSLPFNWTFNRGLGGGTLYMYFLPQEAFPIKLLGKFGLTNVELDEDLLDTYDPSYIEYLRYGLAEYICSEYGVLFNPQSAAILKAIEDQLMYIMPPDLAQTKTSVLTRGSPLNFADVNIGRGWRP